MLKCLTYYVIVICMVLFYATQMGGEQIATKPLPGQESYGYTMSDDEAVIMDMTIIKLAREYHFNRYGTYPVAFYKEVTLSDSKQEKMGEILSEVTEISVSDLDEVLDTYFKEIYIMNSSEAVNQEESTEPESEVSQEDIVMLEAASDLTYERFTELMTSADKLLGGGSSYAKDKQQSNAYVPMTYEQALEEYNVLIEKDHLSTAYARLFSDYFSIDLALLPVFIAVTRGLRDRRARAHEVIYTRKGSSWQIVLSRYLAMVVMLLLPVILLSSFLSIGCILQGVKDGIALDYFAFAKYIGGWLLPTILITTSLGVFLTELTDSAIAIFVQGIWWFISLSSGNLVGNCGWNLIPRHNSLGYRDIFIENLRQLVMNRIVYGLAAILLLIATVWIYDSKRKGRIDLRGTIFRNRKNKSKA